MEAVDMSAKDGWTRKGTGWSKERFVGDAQVLYTVKKEDFGSNYVAERHVAGASKILVVGRSVRPENAKRYADQDADQVQEKGF